MSRRKQSQPKPIKALAESDVCKWLTPCWSNVRDKGNTRNTLSSETPGSSCSVNQDSVVNLDCSSGASSSSQTPATSVSQVAATSAPLFVSFEKLRWEQMPQNVTWDQEAASKTDSNVDKCQICSQRQEGSKLTSPVEGTDYFIDSDGTLSVRNGVCPRSLALSLFSEVFFQRSKYAQLLGVNFLKFLMNLKQIVARHKPLCPGENPYDFMKAENVLKNFSLTKKEFLELSNRDNASELTDTLKEEAKHLKAMEYATVFPNTSYSSLVGISDREGLLRDVTSEQENKVINSLLGSATEHDLVGNSDFTTNSKGGISDSGSPKSSGNSSPSLSLCSVNSVPGMPDRAKQAAATKRGCKILPVSSTDGQTHYPCPVCRLELSSDHELTVHIRSHNQSGQQSTTNSCTICGKTLSSQSSLDRHMLVHSGERPFKCKFCDMSFTTNGNMHRHARIHEKNGTATLKSSGRKYSENKTPSNEDLHFREEKSLVPKAHQPTSVLSEFVANKADLLNREYDHGSPFLQPYYSCFFPYSTSHHPAFPYQRLIQYPAQVAFPFLQSSLYPLTSESMVECLQFSATVASDLVREPSPDLRAQQKLHCNVCEAVFTNPFSLESHMETHIIVDEKLEAESGSACKSCKAVAKSEASLLLHALKYHKQEAEVEEPDLKSEASDTSSALATPKSSSSSTLTHHNINNNSVGFQDLGFVSFTSKKFPLIAKAFCESNPSTKASGLPVFKCQNCDLEFPVEGAKHLHEVSHVPEEYTVCPKCSCHFSEPSRLQEHMQKHVADLKFEESYGQKDQEPGKYMLQYHFLAQFGLIPKEEDSHGMKIYSCEKDTTGIEGKLINSDDNNDDNKMARFGREENNNLQSKETNIHTPCKDKRENYYEMHCSVSDSETCSLLPLVSFGTPESNELLKFPSPSTSADGNTSQQVSDQSFEASAPLMYPCQFCSLEFPSQKALKYHLYSHKNTPQFQCKVCRYSSTDKNTLLRHIRTHSGERPFKCAVCEYSFTTKANCERHLRHKHGLGKNQVSEKLVFNKCVVAKKKSFSGSGHNTHYGKNQSSESKFREFGFSDWRFPHSQQHYLNSDFHLDYMCTSCKETFPSHSSVLKHIDIHHPDTDQADVQRLIARVQGAGVDLKAALGCPPPAHIKLSMPSTISVEPPLFNTVTVKKELSFSSLPDKAMRPDSNDLPQQFGLFFNTEEEIFKTTTEKPLDFSKRRQYVPVKQEDGHVFVNKSLSLMESSLEAAPVDLSVPKSSHSSPLPPLLTDQVQITDNQKCPDLLPVYVKSYLEKSEPHKCHESDPTVTADIVEDDPMLNNKRHSGIKESTTNLLEKSSNAVEDMDLLKKKGFPQDQKRCTKITFNKGVSSESDSSCELASVNKILDATYAQKFHNFLHVTETEDVSEMQMSESSSSDEDIIVESAYSPSQGTPPENHLLARPTEATMDKKKMSFTDANTLSEQAVTELIKKVSQESGISPAKKKKNSYADSPHKFSCPYCTRCFPWHSSLNRHLLTHTGQKPFKCPRCPVTFSTKSNRERHLIRKHNVNMLDPASRSTMDRPYKCHVCMFSSFSTQNNLIKHYKDKHRHLAPIQGLGIEKTNDGEWDDSQLSSYEVDEEYNSVIEMQGKMSDREIMYENYTQDSDSNHSNNSAACLYNFSNKGKSVFHVNTNGNHINGAKISGNSSHTDACDDLPINSQTEHQVFDQALASHNHARQQKEFFGSYSFKCCFCHSSFTSRVECLQHFETMHKEVWAVLKEKNEIGNIEVFSAKLDKITEKLCKTEQVVNKTCKTARQDHDPVKNSLDTIEGEQTDSNECPDRSATDTAAEIMNTIHDTKTDTPRLEENGFSRSSCDDVPNPEVSREITAEISLRKICCAVCPRRFRSLEDLRKHMHSHTDLHKGHVSQSKLAGTSSLAYLPTSVITSPTVSSSRLPETISEGGHGNNLDMLHNLLGVESATIDKIFECSDSAASLLGV